MIKGYVPPKKQPTPPDFGQGLASVSILINDLQNTKKDVVTTIDQKIKQVDSVLENANTTLDKKVKDIDKTISDAQSTIKDTADEALQIIKDTKQGEPGKDAEEVDTEEIVKDVLALMPKFDAEAFSTSLLSKIPIVNEDVLLKKLIKKLPKSKADLKIIQGNIETDPMSVIDQIMALPEDKFKLKTSQIDGLDQTIRSFRSQLGRGYLHGGGDTVKAGANITITTNAQGQKVISSTGGGSSITLETNGVLNGSQSVLNLKAGTNMTIIDDGVGGITFTSSGGSANLVVGSSTITSGTTTRVLFDNAGVLGEYAISGTGSVAMTASPTFTGVPAAPTATVGTNTTQIATTAFVLANAGGGTPGGLNTQIQYNNAGSFGGITGATTNGTIVSLTNPLLGGATLTTSTVNGVTLTTGGGTTTFLNANGTYSTPAGSGGITIGTTSITSGTTTRVLFDNAGVVGEYVISGTGNVAMTTSPVFTTPNIGSATGSVSGNAGTATVLATGRTISISGDLTYASPSFDGSGNVTAAGTLTSVITAGGPTGSATVAPIITYDAKGRLTAVSSATITPAVGSITGLGTGIATFLATPSSANLAAAVTDETGSGALVFATSPTLSNPIVGTQSPNDNSTKGASTAYVDAGVAAGIASVNAGDSVDYATSAILPNSPIYNNGASGVGATITTLTTNTALVVDGATPTIGQEVLVKNEGDGSGLGASRNGIYVLTTPASLGVAWILTRATDYNSASDINNLGLIYTRNGGTTGGSTGNAGISYALVARITTVGTDSITYQVGAPKASTIITNGGPLGTPSSGTGTNITGIPAANILAGTFGTGDYSFGTSNKITVGTIELGAASDTTLSRVSAGVIAVEGVTIADVSSSQTLTNKTLTVPIISGTAAADGALGFDSTQHTPTYYSSATASLGFIPRVMSIVLPGTALTNSTTSDQDYSAVYTIPANALISGKTYRVTLFTRMTTGVSSATILLYLKVGGTKMYTTVALNQTDSIDRWMSCQFTIMGTAAASGSASVQVGSIMTPLASGIGAAQANSIAPQNLATNGTLAIVPGITFGSTGSTETITLLSSITEELSSN